MPKYIAVTVALCLPIFGSPTVNAAEPVTVKLGRSVLAVAFHPNSKLVAAGGEPFGLVWMWSIRGKKVEYTLEHGAYTTVTSLVFADSGKTLIAGCCTNALVASWSLGPRRGRVIERGLGDSAIALSSGDQFLAAATSRGRLKVWERKTGRVLVNEKTGTGITSVSFHPVTPMSLAVANASPRIQLWDVASAKVVRTVDSGPDKVDCVRFSPDGKLLATSDWHGVIKLWETTHYTEVATLRGHKLGICALAFSPDGSILASGGGDQTLRFWDTKVKKPLGALEAHKDVVSCIAFAPDGGVVASSSYDGTMKLWDVKELLQEFRRGKKPGHR